MVAIHYSKKPAPYARKRGIAPAAFSRLTVRLDSTYNSDYYSRILLVTPLLSTPPFKYFSLSPPQRWGWVVKKAETWVAPADKHDRAD